MNKKNIILIICIAIAIAIIICAILMVLLPKNINSTSIIRIEKYNTNFETEQVIEVKNSKDTKQLLKACNEETLNDDGVPQNLAIRKDLKIDLKNGTYFIIQQDLQEYCYYENTNTGKKMIVEMPEELIEYIYSIFK